jgi:hypothetical protein
MNPHHFGKLDPNPHSDPYHSGKLEPDPHRSEKQDPDPHHSEKVEALEGHFGALEGPNMEKVSGRIQIRICINFKGRARFGIRISER